MAKHIADQPRDRAAGARAREYARIERERGAGGPHLATRLLQRRSAEAWASGRRTQEFLHRERRWRD